MRSELPGEHRPLWKRGLLALLRPKVGIPLIVVLALLSAPLVYRASQTAGLPAIGEPFDLESLPQELPAENAFDDYRAAAALKVALAAPHLADLDASLETGWEATTPEVRQWLEDNRAALHRWRTGTEKADAMLYVPRAVTIDTALPALQEIRDFGRVASLEAMRLETAGDLEEAWRVHRAAFRSSRHCGLHGCMIERLVGIALHSIATLGIARWADDPQVTSEQLRSAIDDLESDYEMTAPSSTCFKLEYVMWKNLIAMTDLKGIDSMIGTPGQGYEQRRVLYFVKNEPELSDRVMRHAYANLLAQIDVPRNLRAPKFSEDPLLFELKLGSTGNSDLIPPDQVKEYHDKSILARYLLPASEQVDAAIALEQARQAALLTLLGAQVYRREQGMWPERSTDLERVLGEVPADPFGAAGDQIRFRRDGDRFVVWSVGANQLDDGGMIDASRGKNSPDVGFVVEEGPAEAERPECSSIPRQRE